MKPLRAGTVAIPYLRQWREYRLLTRANLANLAHLSEPAIEKLEMGRASGAFNSTVRKLAGALGITPEVLMHHAPGEASDNDAQPPAGAW